MRMDDDGRSVLLTVPANPDYLVLARLALSAVCRLTPLEADDVADLKLALTEAATGLLPAGPPSGDARLGFAFRLGDAELILEIDGAAEPAASAEEQELTRAIIAATIDESEYATGTVRLVKYLGRQ